MVGCGHCKALAPAYEEVATTFRAEQNVSVSVKHGRGYSRVCVHVDVVCGG